jgi:hypothetical protein
MQRKFRLLLAAASLLTASHHVHADSPALTVPATADIFSAGLDSPIAPGGGGAGTLPIAIAVSPGQAGFQLSASGSVSQYYEAFFHGPDGLPNYAENITDYGGISGFVTDQLMPLTAVFLTDAAAQPPAPAPLDFSSLGLGRDFLTLSPAIGQVFFVGDGQTDGGQTQTFYVPSGATRLFLGFPDAVNSLGLPGGYDDNEGSLQVAVTFVPEPSMPALAALGVALSGVCPRQKRQS